MVLAHKNTDQSVTITYRNYIRGNIVKWRAYRTEYSGNGSNKADVGIFSDSKWIDFDQYRCRIRQCWSKHQLI